MLQICRRRNPHGALRRYHVSPWQSLRARHVAVGGYDYDYLTPRVPRKGLGPTMVRCALSLWCGVHCLYGRCALLLLLFVVVYCLLFAGMVWVVVVRALWNWFPLTTDWGAGGGGAVEVDPFPFPHLNLAALGLQISVRKQRLTLF